MKDKKKKSKEKQELIKNKIEETPILKEVVEFEEDGELIRDISNKKLN
jgi:hypothetical protein